MQAPLLHKRHTSSSAPFLASFPSTARSSSVPSAPLPKTDEHYSQAHSLYSQGIASLLHRSQPPISTGVAEHFNFLVLHPSHAVRTVIPFLSISPGRGIHPECADATAKSEEVGETEEGEAPLDREAAGPAMGLDGLRGDMEVCVREKWMDRYPEISRDDTETTKCLG